MSNYAIFGIGVVVGVFGGIFLLGLAIGIGQFIYFGDGEWGHWTNVSDRPKEIDGCWEKVERQLRVLNGGKRG